MKKINLKYIHILILLVGIIFISLSIFHTNMWFDESYSVAIVRHSFADIWKMSGNDVHPPFYYFCLHLLYLVFGNNLIAYRVFSAFTIALLGVLGYTHIRKDFGEKTGILFTFLSLFLPVAAQYAGEIRMYSLGMLLGTIMAIYAYRIYQGKITKTTYIFFGLSSLLVSYTHYYGLMLAGIINLLLFIFLCKNVKTRKQDLIKFTVIAIIQVALYIPWLVNFIKQIGVVSTGFWTTLSFPDTIYDILTTQFRGNLKIYPIVLCTAFYAYLIYLISRIKKEERNLALLSCYIYLGIILIALLISMVMHTVILVYRYLIILTGLLIFAISFFMSKDQKVWRILTVCGIILIVSIISNIKAINESYAPLNRDWIAYMEENLQDGDIILYTNAINGGVVTTDLSNKLNIKTYYWNEDKWHVEQSYKVYEPYMEIKSTLEEIIENYKGRIWLIENYNDNSLREKIEQKYSINKIDEHVFKVPYRDYTYTIELIEK